MLNKVSEAIISQEYQKALELIAQHIQSGNPYTDTTAILEGSVYLETNQLEAAFRCISDGLTLNPLNYELYFMLGNLYKTQNQLQKAYLCYENALYHCRENTEDYSFLSSCFETFKSNTGTILPKVSIILLTLNQLEYTRKCIDSIRKYCSPSAYELIVVDNGSSDETKQYLMSQKDIKYHFNEKNLGFSGGCNVGIHMSHIENDILLLNNDTIMTENALFTLRMGLYENDNVGASGAVSNYAAQQTIPKTFHSLEEYVAYGFTNNIPKNNALEYKIFLSGFAFLLKRSAYEMIGEWDEQFYPGNYEDNDYCTRLILNDYKLVLCTNSFIFHYGSSTFAQLTKQTGATYNSYSEENRQRYIKKWNINPSYSCYCRHDLLHLMPTQDKLQPIHVLDIGCACGATLLGVKNKFPNASLYGIELDEHSASFASHVATVVQGNAETLDNPFSVTYDYILMGDILEHLVHPEKLLNKIRNWLSPGGCIITSIPNILHFSAILPILQGSFTYSDAGVLDRTHLRFFTLYNSVKLLEGAGYKIIEYIQNRTPEEALSKETCDFIEQLVQLPKVMDKEQFTTLQYVFKATLDTKKIG